MDTPPTRGPALTHNRYPLGVLLSARLIPLRGSGRSTIYTRRNPGGYRFARSPYPRDLNELAASIVDEATGESPSTEPPPEKDPAAVELGRRGGLKDGKARALPR